METWLQCLTECQQQCDVWEQVLGNTCEYFELYKIEVRERVTVTKLDSLSVGWLCPK